MHVLSVLGFGLYLEWEIMNILVACMLCKSHMYIYIKAGVLVKIWKFI